MTSHTTITTETTLTITDRELGLMLQNAGEIPVHFADGFVIKIAMSAIKTGCLEVKLSKVETPKEPRQ